MTKEREKKPPVSATVEPETLEDSIRARAYELYQERGKQDGHDLDDWLQAEAEVTASEHRSSAA